MVIAGLVRDDVRQTLAGYPGLSKLPIFGTLFRSKEFQRHELELVIIVTAHLVTPTQGEALALPTDRVKPPSEKDLFLYGQIAKDRRPTSGAAGEVAKQDFSGSYGYVMD